MEEKDQMPWEEKTVEMSREEFVMRVLAEEASLSALCREYGISRPTGYKWLGRRERGEGLSNQSRAPKQRPTRTAWETEKLILDHRKERPAIEAVKIKRILEKQEGKTLPSARTINTILKRNGMITEEASKAATPYQRFEKASPNEMWQADFKGHFAMKGGQRCHPLNILDDHSRFNLCADALNGESYEAVRPSMLRMFEAYGLPRSFLCDNGNPWGVNQITGYSSFEVWLMDLGVLTLHCRPRHPQTQGKEERFNQSMLKELLRYTEMENFAHAQKEFDAYRQFYNHVRPHHALNLDVPADRYQPSRRRLPEKIEAWEYPQGYETRRVGHKGTFSYRGVSYFLSMAFSGKTIAIRPSHIPGCISLFYRQFRIGRIDMEQEAFTLKRAYLIDGDPRLQHRAEV